MRPAPVGVRAPRAALVVLVTALTALAALPTVAAAQGVHPEPRWKIVARTAPTYFPPGGKGMITAVIVNVGDAPVEGTVADPIEVTDTLPPARAGVGKVSATGSMAIQAMAGFDDENIKPDDEEGEKGNSADLPCEVKPILRCAIIGTLPPDISVSIKIPVEAALEGGIDPQAETALGENRLEVEGGVYELDEASVAAPSQSSEQPLSASSTPPSFGVERFEVAAEEEDGGADLQAGSHPFQLTTTIAFNQTLTLETEAGTEPKLLPGAPQLVKNVETTLPAGLVGNTLKELNKAPGGGTDDQCSQEDFSTVPEGDFNLCPAESAIGVAVVTFRDPGFGLGYATYSIPVFNLAPEGAAARLGFEFEKIPVVLSASVKTGEGYAVEVKSEYTSELAEVQSIVLSVWGVPGDSRHNDARGWECLGGGYRYETAGGKPETKIPGHECEPLDITQAGAYLTLPTVCGGSQANLVSSLQVHSWKSGETPPPATSASSGTLDCDTPLAFEPSVSLQPDESAASTPTGLKTNITLPQAGTLQAEGLAEADVEQTTVALPEGLQVNPAAATGLQTCPTAVAGFEEQGDEGLTGDLAEQLFSPEEAQCPAAATLGAVRIHSPLLEHALEGSVYLGSQDTNPFASPLVMYLIAEDKYSGVRVKLAGEVQIAADGRLTAVFKHTPPLPFESLELNLLNGPRAAQVTPARCKLETSTATFVSWAQSATEASSSFTPTPNPDGASCAESGPLSFSPSASAGSANAQAGAFSPFTLTIEKPDGEQALESITAQLPEGLAAEIASVEPCPASAVESLPTITPSSEPEGGPCGEGSLIGHTLTSSGLGGEPVSLEGDLYITRGFDGAPFGLLARTKAQAGPFDLGYVNVLSTVSVNETTAAVTTKTVAPIPTRIDGVPVELKKVEVEVSRANFEFNPTDCDELKVTGQLGGSEGAGSSISYPFFASGCSKLPFEPKLTAEVQGQGSKLDGTEFKVTIESPGLGQANIHKVDLTIPSLLPSRLTTIQKACPEASFNANPAACDEGSVIGEGIVHTPVLEDPLRGPAYLVSHGGAAFPDVEFVLQGEGVKLVVDGKTDIKNKVTYSKFETAPDAPFTTFESIFPAGPHSALAPNVPESENFNLCKQTLTLPTEITAQDGAFMSRQTPIRVVGCQRVKSYRATKAQQLAKALAACRAKYKGDKHKHKRLACERAARRKYAAKGERSSEETKGKRSAAKTSKPATKTSKPATKASKPAKHAGSKT
jgi:hypothetical protein